MGAWGEGMQANDTALDFVPDVENLPKEEAHEAFRNSKAWGFTGDYDIRQQAVLGMAEHLIDVGYGVPKDLIPKVEEQIDDQLQSSKLQCWAEPDARKNALLRFRKRMHGQEVDEKELAIDNAGLFQRMGASRKEMSDRVDEAERSEDDSE